MQKQKRQLRAFLCCKGPAASAMGCAKAPRACANPKRGGMCDRREQIPERGLPYMQKQKRQLRAFVCCKGPTGEV